MGLLFIATGCLHFSSTEFLLRMMPPYVPLPIWGVYLSGVLEIVFGLLLALGLILGFIRWALIALLVAVFPANIHMALNPELFPEIGRQLAWARLPCQLLFIAAVLWTTKRRD